MSFNALIGWLTIAASTTLGSFIILVGIDLAAAVVLSYRNHTFDPHKLGDFLSAQFATRKFVAVLGLGAAAGMTALASTLVSGSVTEAALQGVAQVALAAATAGAAAMIASIVADLASKFQQLFQRAPTPPPVGPDPIPVTVVPPAFFVRDPPPK